MILEFFEAPKLAAVGLSVVIGLLVIVKNKTKNTVDDRVFDLIIKAFTHAEFFTKDKSKEAIKHFNTTYASKFKKDAPKNIKELALKSWKEFSMSLKKK